MYTGPDPITETPSGTHIHAYPKVRYPSHVPALFEGTSDITVQEKLDGGNTRVRLNTDGTRVYGSKTQIHGTTPDDVPVFFKRAVTHIHETISTHTQRDLLDTYGPLTIFCENMLYHSLDYNFNEMPPALVFDIYSHTQDRFLNVDTARSLTQHLGLAFVPTLDPISPHELSQYLRRTRPPATTDDTTPTLEFTNYPIPDSVYRDGLAEGVVFKNYDTQTFAKFVSEEFSEANKARWGDTLKDRETGEGLAAVDYTRYIPAKYCSDTRIEKAIRKLVMNGNPLSMKLTPDLFDAVYHDIWDEHGHEFITSGKTIDTQRLQTIVMDRCRGRLKAAVRNKELLAETTDGEFDDADFLELRAIGKPPDE